jgi:hypothetical protein
LYHRIMLKDFILRAPSVDDRLLSDLCRSPPLACSPVSHLGMQFCGWPPLHRARPSLTIMSNGSPSARVYAAATASSEPCFVLLFQPLRSARLHSYCWSRLCLSLPP